ncbi:hypothetical protein TURU_055885 [Turdus rufiventris]|nr:hypothetical protein TURU_055885 [Turdus rufiventris]
MEQQRACPGPAGYRRARRPMAAGKFFTAWVELKVYLRLTAELQVKGQIKMYEEVPVLLSLLHSDHIKLQWNIVWILVQVGEDPETSVEIWIWGGIKQLLHMLQKDRSLVSDDSSAERFSGGNAAGRIHHLHLSDESSPDRIQENSYFMQVQHLALGLVKLHQIPMGPFLELVQVPLDGIPFSSPEAVNGELYGEKADVWAAGCILYQMATLNPAFYSTYILSLATKTSPWFNLCPLPLALTLCTPEKDVAMPSHYAEVHPDIVEVCTLLSDVMMKYMDVLPTSHLMLEKKLDQERRQTQQYFMQANQSAVTYHHQLSILSQVAGGPQREKLLEGAQSWMALKMDMLLAKAGPMREAGIFSQLDSEIDIVDNSSSSSSSNLKESAIALAGIAVAQRKVHQISDPIQQILIQLHKIIFITQLLQGSPESTEPNIFTADWHGVHLSSGGNMLLPDNREGILGTSGMAEGITNEQLQVSPLSEGNKELSRKGREHVILNNGFGIVPNEVNLPVLQQRLITKESSFAY